ncbi:MULTISPECIES: flagellar hook-length control protein FliK [unclassified Novosphingobium]|uniref:flagellar hook-length control protein FliK n=1 Tax=unclassified Novosphingobium TaxID=2644732 RepID=UPI00135BEB5B|nr:MULTISPECIES: flagellar hook-length control protein FliK [unclassified Novosphingobium]
MPLPTGLQDTPQPATTPAVPPQPLASPAASPAATSAPTPAGSEVAPTITATPHETAAKPAEHAAPDQAARTHAAPETATTRTHGDTPAPADGGPANTSPTPEARVSAPLFSQTLETVNTRHAALPYAPAQAEMTSATVALREGRFGADVGVSIARALGGGQDDTQDGGARDLLIRIDPRHMGRIDVRMSFDNDGVLRAVVSTDSPATLDMLRRESADLSRALTDAGVRSDPQSLRFDSSAGGGSGGQSRQGQRTQAQAPDYGGASDFAGSGDEIPIHRSLRGSGHVDLMA